MEKEISKEAIFQYYKSVSYGRRGDYYRDFGIRIYRNGRVEYMTYYYYMKSRTNLETEISSLAAERIRELLLQNQDSMERTPRRLYNGSCAKNAVEQKVVTNISSNATKKSKIDELRDLKGLLEEGIITRRVHNAEQKKTIEG